LVTTAAGLGGYITMRQPVALGLGRFAAVATEA